MNLASRPATADLRATLLTWGPIVVVGLLLYIVGRSQEILMFEVGSLIWLLTGIRRKIKPQEKSPSAAHDHDLLTRPLNLRTLTPA